MASSSFGSCCFFPWVLWASAVFFSGNKHHRKDEDEGSTISRRRRPSRSTQKEAEDNSTPQKGGREKAPLPTRRREGSTRERWKNSTTQQGERGKTPHSKEENGSTTEKERETSPSPSLFWAVVPFTSRCDLLLLLVVMLRLLWVSRSFPFLEMNFSGALHCTHAYAHFFLLRTSHVMTARVAQDCHVLRVSQNHSIFSHVSLACSLLFASSDFLFTNLFSDATLRILYTTDWNRKTPVRDSALGGPSGHPADPTPNTGYERKLCINVSSEHSPINLPTRNMGFQQE